MIVMFAGWVLAAPMTTGMLHMAVRQAYGIEPPLWVRVWTYVVGVVLGAAWPLLVLVWAVRAIVGRVRQER